MRDNGGVKLENTFVPSTDGSSLDEEAKEEPATKEMTKAAEGPPEGAECMSSKDNHAWRQQTFKSAQEAAKVKTSPEGPAGPPRGFDSIQRKVGNDCVSSLMLPLYDHEGV